jgi:fucose permease
MTSITDSKFNSQAKIRSKLAQLYQHNKYFLCFLVTLLYIRSTVINWNYIPSASVNPNLSLDSRYFDSLQRDKIVGKVNTVLFNYLQIWQALTLQKVNLKNRFFKQRNYLAQLNIPLTK